METEQAEKKNMWVEFFGSPETEKTNTYHMWLYREKEKRVERGKKEKKSKSL